MFGVGYLSAPETTTRRRIVSLIQANRFGYYTRFFLHMLSIYVNTIIYYYCEADVNNTIIIHLNSVWVFEQ